MMGENAPGGAPVGASPLISRAFLVGDDQYQTQGQGLEKSDGHGERAELPALRR